MPVGSEGITPTGTTSQTLGSQPSPGPRRQAAKRRLPAFGSHSGFPVRATANVHRMLEREQPDIVGICSPPDRHTEHTLAALEAGARVLCEKPLVVDFSKDPESWIAQGVQMVERALSLERSFGMTPQLAAAAPFYWQLYRKFRDPVRYDYRIFRGDEEQAPPWGKEVRSALVRPLPSPACPFNSVLSWWGDRSVHHILPGSARRTLGPNSNGRALQATSTPGFC